MSETIELEIGFSPCPNDTFIFDALVNGRIDTKPYLFHPRIADVEELNMRAFSGSWQVTKLSFYAYLLLKERYLLLDAGAALGSWSQGPRSSRLRGRASPFRDATRPLTCSCSSGWGARGRRRWSL